MKRRKIKWKNIILFIIIIILLLVLSLSIYKIINWCIESRNTRNELNNIYKKIEIKEINDGINLNEDNIDSNDPYWDYIKMDLIDVDFSSLKTINNEVVGWIKVNGTNINYPFVQTDNNSYYLTHSFNKKYNKAGWVFMDYRNNIEDFDKNTIIYAHGRLDNTMFGSLRNILKNDWYNDSNNYIIKLSTKNENTLWQVFSVYKIATTNDYIKVDFNDNYSFKKFTNMLLNRSKFNFHTTVNENDKIMTLSTCYDDSSKVVMHAKLIKVNVKKLTNN